MANTFTLAGTFKDAENNALYAGKYVTFRITSIGTDTEDNVAYPRDKVEFLIDANGDFGGTLWINGDSGVECFYDIKMPDGQRVEVVIPSSVEGTTVRFEDIVELYQTDSTTQQSSVLAQATAYTDTFAADPTNNASFSATAWTDALTPFDELAFNTAAVAGAYTAGVMRWNDTDNTLEFDTGLDAVTIQVGQEVVFKARNNTGVTIPDGSVVRVTGATGNRPTIALAQADSVANAFAAVAITTQDIGNNEDGFCTKFGSVRGVDTSSFSEGSILWLSDTVAGGYTTTKPDIAIGVGVVTQSSAGNGEIGVEFRSQISTYELASDPSAVGGFDATEWKRDLSLQSFVGKSFSPSDTSSGLSIPDDASVDIGTGDFSVFFWSKLSSTSNSADQPIIRKISGADGFDIYMQGSSGGTYGYITTYLGGDSFDGFTSELQNDDVWRFNVLTFDRDSQITHYINGKAVQTTAISAATDESTSTDLTLLFNGSSGGASGVEFANYVGMTKDIITADEVVEMYNDPHTALLLDNLAACLEIPARNQFFDRSPNAAVVTLTGSLDYTGYPESSTATTSVTSTTYTSLITDSNILANNASGVTITLLAAATAGDGFTLTIKNVGASGTVTVDGDGSETIDGATTATLTNQYESITIVCDGSNWYIK